MTKIAITPNASGTGTFTIEAPNSNSNRTFTLPDDTGEVLTDAQNDPAKLFRQDNILGTVSQSSGVPTGAIIERGSNANGEFVRYADGTQICWNALVSVNVDIDIPSVGLFRNRSADIPVTFPVSFSTTPSILVGGASDIATTRTIVSGGTTDEGTSGFGAFLWRGISATEETHTFSWKAIGRWV